MNLIPRWMYSLISPEGQNGKLSILLFHKIPRLANPLQPDELCIDQFSTIVDLLEENFHLVSLTDGINALQKKCIPKRSVAITFDDGYADWLDTVCPLLFNRKIPATFFISTEQLEGDALWHEKIVSAVKVLPSSGAKLPFGFTEYSDLSTLQSKIELVRELQDRLKYQSLPERLSAIKLLEDQATDAIVLPNRFDPQAIRAMHSMGFEIGAHTVRHPILNECSAEEAKREIGESKEQLESIIKAQVKMFAYPNGKPHRDYRAEHVKFVKQCGFSAAFSTSSGVATASSDLYQLPRFSPWGNSRQKIAFQLARNIYSEVPTVPSNEAISQQNEDKSRVRCLLIASTFPPIHGGSAVVYESLCKKLPQGSIRVLTAKKNYINNTEISDWSERDLLANYPIDRVDLLRPLMLPPPQNIVVSLYRLLALDFPLYIKCLVTASRIVRDHNINVVCVGELVTGSWLGIVLRRLFGCKLIIYVHGEEVTTRTEGGHGRLRRRYLHAADKVISVSSFTCDALNREMGLQADAMALVPNGVDTDRFTPQQKDEKFLASMDLTNKKVIVTVGRLVPRKGMDMAIRAMQDVLKHQKNARYIIVGDGEYKEELAQLIELLGLSQQITLTGKVDDSTLLKYLQNCDLFVMPNRTMPDGDTEGFGLVFREANACRKAVVGGRAGGAVEAVLHEKTGLLVNGEQPSEIASAILRILNDETLAKALGDGGYEVAQANNTRAVAEKFYKICDRLLEEKRVIKG